MQIAKLQKRRGKLEIMVDILKETCNPTKKTQIMYQCNMNFEQLKRYLRFMKFKGFIRINEKVGAITYQITEKGWNFVEKYEGLARLLQP